MSGGKVLFVLRLKKGLYIFKRGNKKVGGEKWWMYNSFERGQHFFRRGGGCKKNLWAGEKKIWRGGEKIFKKDTLSSRSFDTFHDFLNNCHTKIMKNIFV